MSLTIQNFFIFSLMLLTTLIFSANCMAGNTLNFGGVSDVQPLTFEDGGIVKGFFPDLFEEVSHRAGFNSTISLFPFKRLNIYLQTGEIDGTISIFYKKEREAYLIYSAYPALISRTRVFVKKGKEFPFNSVSDLFGKKVGKLAGWAIQNAALTQAITEGKIEVDATTRYEENLKKLVGERFDCLIATEQVTWYHINRLGFSDKIVALDHVIAENKTFIAISKHSKKIADPRGFMDKLNEALNSVLSDGTHARLQSKYRIKTLRKTAP